MRVRPVPGLSVSVDAHGRLDVVTAPPVRHVRCGPVGTAVWLALRQHDGDVEGAARMLAALWGTEPANARADLDIWVDELRVAGLVRAEL
ncbi:PqqD family protein [Streptomyces sp. NPDC005423]|uniref:PqqD family protein n=1 Tax=Streptomyces sp. NPDC005423 TaxID=3155343 RepID=UPI0033A2899A